MAQRSALDPSCGLPVVEATRGLGILRQEEDVEILLSLASNSEAAIREAAVGALAELGGDPAMDGVVEALADPSLTVRAKAISVLPKFSQEHSGKLLTRTIRDGSTFERLAAARALACVSGCSEALVATLGDPETQVRKAASASLRERQEPESIRHLVAMLSAPENAQRVEAMRVLAHYRGEESRNQLIAVMQSGAVPAAPLAAGALGLRAEPQAREALEGALVNPPFRIRWRWSTRYRI